MNSTTADQTISVNIMNSTTADQTISLSRNATIAASVFSETSPDSFWNSSSTTPALVTASNAGLSKTVIISISVVAVVALITLVVVGVVLFVRRNRRVQDSKVRVWQIPRTVGVQAEGKTTWHNAVEDTRTFNPDLELQPTNIFPMSEALAENIQDLNDNNGHYQDIETKPRENEAVASGPSEKRFQIQADGKDDRKLTENENDQKLDKVPHILVKGQYYSVVRKKNQPVVTVVEGEDSEHNELDKNGKSQEDLHANNLDQSEVDGLGEDVTDNEAEESEGGVYVAMSIEGGKGENYVNSEIIRISNSEKRKEKILTSDILRADSVQVMPRTDKNDEHYPRRIVSETKLGARQRAPVAQPRLSKKKVFDPYDRPPGIPRRVPVKDDKHGIKEQEEHSDSHEHTNSADIGSKTPDSRKPVPGYDYPKFKYQVSLESDHVYD